MSKEKRNSNKVASELFDEVNKIDAMINSNVKINKETVFEKYDSLLKECSDEKGKRLFTKWRAGLLIRIVGLCLLFIYLWF